MAPTPPQPLGAAEVVRCMQKDMVLLRQQIASMTAKSIQTANEHIVMARAIDDLKGRVSNLEKTVN